MSVYSNVVEVENLITNAQTTKIERSKAKKRENDEKNFDKHICENLWMSKIFDI